MEGCVISTLTSDSSLPEPLHCHSTHSVGSRDFTRRCTCRKEEQQSGVWCRRCEHSKNKRSNRFIGMVQDVAMMSCIHRGEVVVAAGSPPLCSGTQATAWWPTEHCEAARLGTLPQRQRQLRLTLSYLKECEIKGKLYDKAPRHKFCHAYLLGCVCTDGYIWRWCMPLKPLKRWGEAEPDI